MTTLERDRAPRPVKISIENVSKVFHTRAGPVTAIRDLSLVVYEGEFLCIVGPSGCGKTTLLRILAGLERQTSGVVSVNSGDDTRPLSSVVFQEQSVFPWFTVRENVAYGLRMRHVNKKLRDSIADYYIKKIGLTAFADSYPHQLSGGMKQRVSVARAFANDPQILLMDEPFGALDEQNRVLLQQELLKIWEGSQKTAIFITHSIDEALTLGDRVLVMTAHPGTVKAIVDINLPRPRRVTEIRRSPLFLELFTKIWEYLESEVLKAREANGFVQEAQ
ncbi:MAG TPA: ABC transporter ATP-binding protein [Firmicutes bacterium]|nr:ABC transporter ATP-binding protein [Bacillota bacterium]